MDGGDSDATSAVEPSTTPPMPSQQPVELLGPARDHGAARDAVKLLPCALRPSSSAAA